MRLISYFVSFFFGVPVFRLFHKDSVNEVFGYLFGVPEVAESGAPVFCCVTKFSVKECFDEFGGSPVVVQSDA